MSPFSPRTTSAVAACAAALLASAAHAAPASSDSLAEIHAGQAREAEGLMTALYEDHRNEALLHRADRLVEECIDVANYRTAKFVSGQLVYHFPASLEERHRFLRILMARGDYEEAERDLRTLMKERPSDGESYATLAWLFASRGDFRRCLEVHEARLKEHPGDAATLDARARILLWDLRDFEGARREVGRMREAAARPGIPKPLRDWLLADAGDIEASTDRLEKERGLMLRSEGRLRNSLRAALAASALALAAAFWVTRPRAD